MSGLSYKSSTEKKEYKCVSYCYSCRHVNGFDKSVPFESSYNTICMWIRSREGSTIGCCRWDCQSAGDSWGPKASLSLLLLSSFFNTLDPGVADRWGRYSVQTEVCHQHLTFQQRLTITVNFNPKQTAGLYRASHVKSWEDTADSIWYVGYEII